MSAVNVTKHGNNANIKIHVLSKDDMIRAGFRKTNDGGWYKERYITEDITFNVRICPDGDWWIDVLDEDFGQPYDYQAFLEYDPSFDFAKEIKLGVDKEMEKLIKCGILSGWSVGDYV